MFANKEFPLVSIITPSYMQAEFIEETMVSVLEQDYPNIEYLVVDGGSRDGSVDIIQGFAKKLDWWVSEKDEGQADAINKGMAKAKGEVIAWLNSDDLYRPGAIRQAVEELQAHPDVGMVYSDLESIDRNGQVFNTIHYKDYDFEDLLSFRIIGQPTVFIRRDALEKAGALDPSYHYLLDHHLWLRIAEHSNIRYVPTVWAAARHHPGAKNLSQAARFGEEAFRIIDWAKGEKDMRPVLEKNRRKVLAGAHRLNAHYLVEAGEAAQSLRAYGRTFLNYPPEFIKRWKRIMFALISLMGLSWLRRSPIDSKKPILVTGLHRSGTSWVGRMLNLSAKTAYVSEPVNLLHRHGVYGAKVKHWYTYITDENETDFLPAFRETLKLRYKWWKEVISIRTARDLARMIRDGLIFLRGKIMRHRVLLKDPFALFSLLWFSSKLNCDVIVIVRHPAAVVSSLKRLGWTFDFHNLLAQPLLMREWFEPFRQEMEKLAEKPGDLIAEGSLLWRISYHLVHQLQKDHPELHIIRYEELSRSPIEGYRSLYAKVDFPFTERVAKGIRKATQSGNPTEGSLRSIYATKLDSAANLKNWKKRLTAEEIQRIREITQDVAVHFYSEEDWQ